MYIIGINRQDIQVRYYVADPRPYLRLASHVAVNLPLHRLQITIMLCGCIVASIAGGGTCPAHAEAEVAS